MQETVIDDKYLVLRQLGHGGMGVVYECSHALTGRRVALKLLRRDNLARGDEQAVRRFRREARAASMIDSQHAAQVLDVGFDRATQQPYISLELLEGTDLRRLLAAAGKLPPELVARIGAQVCLGLARAHTRGVIHRDIKPANIFLARLDAVQLQVKILDFGIAKLLEDPWASLDSQKLTHSGSLLGSPLYMSPEQAIGSRDLDRRSDIWSLGVVLYEALCGSTPHPNQSIGALVLRICSDAAPPLRSRAPWVSEALARVVDRALALEQAQRFQSAEELYAALSDAADCAGPIDESMFPVTVQAASAPVQDGPLPSHEHTRRLSGSHNTETLMANASTVREQIAEVASLQAQSSTPAKSRRRWPLMAAALLIATVSLIWQLSSSASIQPPQPELKPGPQAIPALPTRAEPPPMHSLTSQDRNPEPGQATPALPTRAEPPPVHSLTSQDRSPEPEPQRESPKPKAARAKRIKAAGNPQPTHDAPKPELGIDREFE